MTTNADRGDISAASRDVIVVDNVSRTYGTDRGVITALEGISLSVRQGEMVSLLGPSGCGKSTLLSLIAGLDSPTSGSLSVNGNQVTGPRPEIGVVFQKDLLFDWRNVIDNVLVPFAMRGSGAAPHRQRAVELLERVGLAGFETRRPYELSGGMRQRVALCRGLIQDPEVLLLDEPFAALDSLTREQMQLDVQTLLIDGGKTSVMVTHDIEEAVFLSDRIVIMSARPGQIVKVVDVDLPRPRNSATRDSAEFVEVEREVHAIFKNLGVLHG